MIRSSHFLSLFVVLGASPAFAGPNYDATITADNPFARWELNETSGTFADDTGTGGANDGTFTGTFTQGVSTFDGGTPGVNFGPGSVTVPFSAGLNPSGPGVGFSVEMWALPDTVNTASGSNRVVLASSVAGGGGNDRGFYFLSNGHGTGAAWQFWTGDGAVSGGNFTSRLTSGNNTVVAGRIYHLVGTMSTIDGVNWTKAFYVNGSLVGSATVSYVANNANNFTIGTGSLGSFDGTMDEVAFYNTALTAGQVEAHYLAGVPEPTTWAIFGAGLLAAAVRKRRRRPA